MRPGLRSCVVAVCLLALGPARTVAADEAGLPAPAASLEIVDDEASVHPPNLFDKAFDLFFLRPFGVVQIVASSVFLVITYPVAVVMGGQDELVRACIRDPAYQTFARPLGRLSDEPD